MRLLFSLLPVVFVAGSVVARADWYDDAWSDRAALTVVSGKIAGGGPLLDFTLVVMMDAEHFASLFAKAQSDGKDILVTGGDGITPWDFELVSYDANAQTGELWLRAPSISESDSLFHIYFGNPDPDLEVVTGDAFTPEHLAVYHFEDTPGNGLVTDSGPGGNFAVEGLGANWQPSDQVTGQLGSAWGFNGSTHWVHTSNVSSAHSSYTISAWFANSDSDDGGCTAMQSEGEFWNVSFQRNAATQKPTLESANAFVIWEPTNVDTEMHHYAWVLDGVGQVARFFYDGVEQAVFLSYAPDPPFLPYTGHVISGQVGIGGPAYFNNLDLSDGVIDEYRIIEGVRSADWLLTEYNNQSDPAAFFLCEFEQFEIATATEPALPGSNAFGRIAVWPNPFQAMARIDIEMVANLREVTIFDLAGRRVRTLAVPRGLDRTVQLQWDGRDDHGEVVSGGVYFVRAQSERGKVGAKLLLVR